MDKIKLQNWNLILVAMVIIAHLVYFNGSKIPKYPVGIHAWANMDRMALARGFERNNLNFFQPQNYILNHQFPGKWLFPSESTRTAVEFPIHDYIPAVFMKLSGNHGPEIFHLYIFLMSFLGMFYLYKWIFLLTESYLKSWFVLVFALLSPVYVFYQGGFLPTIPSISLTIFALYQYTLFYAFEKVKNWNLTIVFFTIAVLARSTYAIPFLAILGFEAVRLLRNKKSWKAQLIPVVISFSLIALSLWYNSYVRSQFGSDFLSELMPARSWSDVQYVFQHMYENWRFSYLTKKHYFLIYGLIVILILSLLVWRKSVKPNYIYFWALLGIWLIGVVTFWIAMNFQFLAHDYYFLDVAFVPVMLLFALILESLPKKWNKTVNTGLAILLVLFLFKAFPDVVKIMEERSVINESDTISGTIVNYKNADKWLDDLGVSKESKLLVMPSYGPNIAFVMMDRIGYAVRETRNPAEFEKALTWNWDYVVFQKHFFLTDVFSFFPQILERVEPVAANENVVLCKRRASNQKIPDVYEFLGFTKVISQKAFDFSSKYPEIKGIKYGKSYNSSFGYVSGDMIYGMQMDLSSFFRAGKSMLLHLKVQYKLAKTGMVPVIFSMEKDTELKYYQGIDLYGVADSLQTMDTTFIISGLFLKEPKWVTYIYNPNKNNIEIFNYEYSLKTTGK